MENVDRELQAAAAQLLTSLRRERGVEDADADRLRNALHVAAAAWSTSEVIPKKAANLFVDLASGTEACSDAHAPADPRRIKELADEVADLIRACL
jgi:hypothetical protein